MPDNKYILEIKNLEKSFGDKKVLKGVDLKIPQKRVFGFVGKNGAGKTTTMKMVLGLMTPNKGEIFVNGEKVTYGNNKTNRYIGYLPDVPEYYSFMTPREYLNFCGEITYMEKKDIRSRSEELLKLVGLGEEKHRIKGFSRGMKQRLGIAQALLNKPKLLICDEPTSALDPVGRKEILDILVAAKEETTILFSTHILSDVEHICDEMALLNDGKIIMQGTIEEVKNKRRGNAIEIQFENKNDTDKLLAIFKKKDSSSLESTSSGALVVKDQKIIPEILRFIGDNSIPFIRIEKQEATLEDIFIDAIQNK
ncbi:MAG: ABC transporter ATP-binding protein [Lachnospiraceae bacterium]|nr:ABC transporter ATP-binding protein [Lachnospiraceae bacterium]